MVELKAILEFEKTISKRRKIGASLFFVLSNTDDKFLVKLIDFAHYYPLKEGEKDEGFIKGLESVIKEFEAILAENK